MHLIPCCSLLSKRATVKANGIFPIRIDQYKDWRLPSCHWKHLQSEFVAVTNKTSTIYDSVPESVLQSPSTQEEKLYSGKFWFQSSGVPRGGWGFNPRPPKFRKSSKIVPNSTRLWKLLNVAEFRKPTPQDVRKKGRKILKLLSFAIVLY